MGFSFRLTDSLVIPIMHTGELNYARQLTARTIITVKRETELENGARMYFPAMKIIDAAMLTVGSAAKDRELQVGPVNG
jgi:hypothetical protein